MSLKRKWQDEDVMDDDSSDDDYDVDSDVEDFTDEESDSDTDPEQNLKRSGSTMTWPQHHSHPYRTHNGRNYQYQTQSHKDWTKETELDEKSPSSPYTSEECSQQATTQQQKDQYHKQTGHSAD